MKVFLTGATGFIGSALVPELIKAGHQVLGLTRSDAGVASLREAGAEAYQGSLEDLKNLRGGVSKADAVIHCAFNNDFSKFKETNEQEMKVIDALGSELIGSTRPLVITSVVAMGIASPGQPATEDHFDCNQPNPLRTSEKAAAAVLDRGSMFRWCVFPRFTTSSSKGSLAVSSRWPGKKESQLTSAREQTDGRRDTCSTSPTSIGLCWKNTKRAADITRRQRKACRCARSQK